MISLNETVKHATFGIGTVVDCQGKYMRVKFKTAEKTFVYPDAFEKFLTLENGTVSEEILADIAEVKRQKQIIEAKKTEEQIHTMTHGIVIPGKEISLFENNDTESRLKNEEPEEL